MSSAGFEQRIAERLIAAPCAPPAIVTGKGSVVTDVDGVSYLDFCAGPGVLALGHGDPDVISAVEEQLRLIAQGPGKFLMLKALEYADALAEVTPPGLDRFFFANSGAEAVDGAVKLALKHASRSGKQGLGIVVLDHGFHGRTSLPLSLTTMPERKRGFGPYTSFPGVLAAEAPYHYRSQLNPDECEAASLESIEQCFAVRAPGEVAVFIAEPIQATGGILVPGPSYWHKVVDLCRAYGVLVIFDEVFTGFGRTGKMFASEHWGVVPDIMTVGKAVGGGLPLAAVVTSERIAGSMDAGDHYTTFGANNVLSFAAGQATLGALQERRVIEAAAENGRYLIDQLRERQDQSRVIGDVRGVGLLVGVELVSDRSSKEVDETLVEHFVGALKRERVLVLTSGYRHATIRLTPPLTVSRDEIDAMLAAFDAALVSVADTSVAAVR